MVEGSNLFDMTKSAINALKKPQIVKRIIELKDTIVVGEEIKSLCTHIKELISQVGGGGQLLNFKSQSGDTYRGGDDFRQSNCFIMTNCW